MTSLFYSFCGLVVLRKMLFVMKFLELQRLWIMSVLMLPCLVMMITMAVTTTLLTNTCGRIFITILILLPALVILWNLIYNHLVQQYSQDHLCHCLLLIPLPLPPQLLRSFLIFMAMGPIGIRLMITPMVVDQLIMEMIFWDIILINNLFSSHLLSRILSLIVLCSSFSLCRFIML